MNILIYNASGHGTSLLAHTFRMCGAYYGKGTVGWSDSFYHHLERSDIEEAMEIRSADYIKEVLLSYNCRAEPSCVVKLTHFTEANWEFLRPILHECWPDCIKFLTVRHPYEMEMRRELRGESRHPYNITDSFDLLSFQLKLMEKEGFKCVHYPADWDTKYIKRIVEGIGLIWNNDIFEMNVPVNYKHAINTTFYAKDKPTRVTGEDRICFSKKHPDTYGKFIEILQRRW